MLTINICISRKCFNNTPAGFRRCIPCMAGHTAVALEAGQEYNKGEPKEEEE